MEIKQLEIAAKQPYYEIFTGTELSREPKKRDFTDFIQLFYEEN